MSIAADLGSVQRSVEVGWDAAAYSNGNSPAPSIRQREAIIRRMAARLRAPDKSDRYRYEAMAEIFRQYEGIEEDLNSYEDYLSQMADSPQKTRDLKAIQDLRENIKDARAGLIPEFSRLGKKTQVSRGVIDYVHGEVDQAARQTQEAFGQPGVGLGSSGEGFRRFLDKQVTKVENAPKSIAKSLWGQGKSALDSVDKGAERTVGISIQNYLLLMLVLLFLFLLNEGKYRLDQLVELLPGGDRTEETATSDTISFGGPPIQEGDIFGEEQVAINSGYGNRVHPIDGIVKFHSGVDWPGRQGRPLYFPFKKGSVECFPGSQTGGFGLTARAKADPELGSPHTDYSIAATHLTSCVPGFYEGGEQFGAVGGDPELEPEKAGYSTGVHLHFMQFPSDGNWMEDHVHPQTNYLKATLDGTPMDVQASGGAFPSAEAERIAVDFIKGFESFDAEAYQDSGGVWTIGWGVTSYPPDGRPVQEGDTVTMEEAEEHFKWHLNKSAADVASLFTAPLTDAEFAALVSFVYNGGAGAVTSRNIDEFWNSGQKGLAKQAMLGLIKDEAGNVLEGLIRRRNEEIQLMESGG